MMPARPSIADELIAALGYGRSAAKHADDLARDLGIKPRRIRRLLQDCGGVLCDVSGRSYAVAGDTWVGYYLLSSVREVRAELSRLDRRAKALFWRRARLQRAMAAILATRQPQADGTQLRMAGGS